MDPVTIISVTAYSFRLYISPVACSESRVIDLNIIRGYAQSQTVSGTDNIFRYSAMISAEERHFLSGKEIIICGIGIAGPSFAIALRKLWRASSGPAPTIRIYERDSEQMSPSREGYTLSIRSDRSSGGIEALQKLGLFDQVFSSSLTGEQNSPGAFTIWKQDWKVLMKMKQSAPEGLPSASMRVRRIVLRRQLIEAIHPEDKIYWGKTAVGAKKIYNGRVEVKLSSGETDECDLLIAADGSKSKLRAAIRPDDILNFTGVVSISGEANFEGSVPQPVDRDWGTVLGGKGTGLFVSPVDDHRALWSVSYITETPRTTTKQPISNDQVDQILQEALDRGKEFAEPFATLVKATDPASLSLTSLMDKSPFKHKADEINALPVVFIGDSNHAVTPFAGNGANMALIDGYDLAEQLAKSTSLDTAIMNYDNSSFPRSCSTLRFSHQSISIAHSQGLKMKAYSVFMKIISLLFFRS